MLRNSTLFLLTLCALPFVGCQQTPDPTGPESLPPMTREKTPPVTTVSEPYSYGQPTEGNFESLVADYESKSRAIWQKPDIVISLLGDLEGKTVADIGAGTGYFTFRLVPRAQRVIGIDIDQRFISFMDSVKVRLPQQYRNRFETRLAKPEDPLLKPNEADAVTIVNTYGYIEHRVAYLKTLAAGMSTHGTLLIIDFKKNSLPVGPSDEYKISTRQVEQELRSAGFDVSKIDTETLDYQYIILATRSK